jgi:hypothetical protein
MAPPSASNSSTFDGYDEEFRSLLQQIDESLQTEPPGPYTENLLQQCADLVKQMALEARTCTDDSTLKHNRLAQVRACKAELAGYQQVAAKKSLYGNNNTNSTSQQQDRLLQQKKTEDTVAQQNETLERARRTMLETEAVALEITEELGHNREKLIATSGRVREVSGMTGRARRILQTMSARAVQQKVVLMGVSVSFVLGFVILLWTVWH